MQDAAGGGGRYTCTGRVAGGAKSSRKAPRTCRCLPCHFLYSSSYRSHTHSLQALCGEGARACVSHCWMPGLYISGAGCGAMPTGADHGALTMHRHVCASAHSCMSGDTTRTHACARAHPHPHIHTCTRTHLAAIRGVRLRRRRAVQHIAGAAQGAAEQPQGGCAAAAAAATCNKHVWRAWPLYASRRGQQQSGSVKGGQFWDGVDCHQAVCTVEGGAVMAWNQ